MFLRHARTAGALYLASLAAALAILAASGPLEIALHEGPTSDLSHIWAGPRALLAGYDPYDPAGWSAATAALGTQRAAWPLVYSYPPAVLLALVPLALLPLPVVIVLWLAASPLAAAFAMRALLADLAPTAWGMHLIAPIALLLSAPAVIGLRGGQWSFVLVAALALAVLHVRREHAMRGAALTAVLLVKAHLFLLAIPSLALAAGRARRYALALTGLAAIPALGSALARPEWWRAWWNDVAVARPAEPHITTAWRVLSDAVGAPGVPLAAALAVGCVVLIGAVRGDGEAAMALGIASSLMIAPYMRSYDHLLALVPIVLAAGILARAHPGLADLFGAAALGTFTLATWALLRVGEERANESLSWVVLPAVLALVVAAVAMARGPNATRARPPGSPRP